MRCPSCEKFVGLETPDEPEEQDEFEVTDDGENGFTLTGSVRLPRTCADCSEELMETTFEFEQEGEIEHAEGCDPQERELTVEHEDTVTDDGGGRYKKRMIGVSIDCTVTCSCGATGTATLVDSCAASRFDSMV